MKVLYVFDPLCGWCYGFSPVIKAFADKHKATVEVEVISGGMITGNRIGPIGEVAPYIKEAFKTVEERTGVKFGQAFLRDVLAEGSTIFNSIPPSKALSVVKKLNPTAALDFASALQTAIYYDGLKPEDVNALSALAAQFDITADQFLMAYNSEAIAQATQADFQYSAQLGVSGFPTVILSYNGKMVAISRGYTDLERLENQFQQGVLMLQ